MALLFIILAFSLVSAAPLRNITITVPEATSNHGDPRLLCTPTTATDVAVFFLGNYFAHLGTIILLPGEAPLAVFFSMLSTLFYPVSGVRRGIEAIRKHAKFRKQTPEERQERTLLRTVITAGLKTRTAFETALRAGALCEVVRTPDWKPRPKDHIQHIQILPQPPVSGEIKRQDEISNRDATEGGPLQHDRRADIQKHTIVARIHVRKIFSECFTPTKSFWSSSGRQVHGNCPLPPGYALAIVPPGANVRILSDETEVPQDGNGSGTGDRLKHETIFLQSFLQSFLWFTQSIVGNSPAQRKSLIHSFEICSSHSILRGLISIFQLVYASFTLYRTRGDQLSRYGYAAFGLTVTPYLVMSFVNLLGSLLTPSYPCVYLMRTSVMEEAERRGYGNFDAITVAKASSSRLGQNGQRFKTLQELIQDALSPTPRETPTMVSIVYAEVFKFFLNLEKRYTEIFKVLVGFKERKNPVVTWKLTKIDDGEFEFAEEAERSHSSSSPSFEADTTADSVHKAKIPHSVFKRKAIVPPLQSSIMRCLCTSVGFLPFAIIGPLSHFENGESTKAQRGWTMAWLVVGITFGSQCYEIIENLSSNVASSNSFNFFRVPLLNVLVILTYGVAMIGGMVVVGQMLIDYGSCVRMY